MGRKRTPQAKKTESGGKEKDQPSDKTAKKAEKAVVKTKESTSSSTDASRKRVRSGDSSGEPSQPLPIGEESGQDSPTVGQGSSKEEVSSPEKRARRPSNEHTDDEGFTPYISPKKRRSDKRASAEKKPIPHQLLVKLKAYYKNPGRLREKEKCVDRVYVKIRKEDLIEIKAKKMKYLPKYFMNENAGHRNGRVYEVAKTLKGVNLYPSEMPTFRSSADERRFAISLRDIFSGPYESNRKQITVFFYDFYCKAGENSRHRVVLILCVKGSQEEKELSKYLPELENGNDFVHFFREEGRTRRSQRLQLRLGAPSRFMYKLFVLFDVPKPENLEEIVCEEATETPSSELASVNWTCEKCSLPEDSQDFPDLSLEAGPSTSK